MASRLRCLPIQCSLRLSRSLRHRCLTLTNVVEAVQVANKQGQNLEPVTPEEQRAFYSSPG